MQKTTDRLNNVKIDFNELSNLDIEDILHGQNHNKKTDQNRCPECDSVDFIEDYSKGIILCLCGQVIDNIFDTGLEQRNYDGDDGEVARCGIVHNRLLPQSSLGTTVNVKGKLRKLHIWNSMPYKERSNNVMFKKIHEVCITNNIYKKIEDDAKILCKRASGTLHKTGKNIGKPIITRGYNREGIVASCLFLACRRNDETRSTKEIASYFGIDERDINKGTRSLLGILEDDQIVKDIGTSKVIHFIKRKCDELQIKTKYANMAVTIGKNIDKLNIASNHTTFSLAAASILLMADINNLKSITKKKLSKAFENLSDVTIGKTFKQIKQYDTLLINDQKVGEILVNVCKLKKKKVISEEVWFQMKRFDVDTSKYVLEGSENYSDNSDSDLDIYDKLSDIYDDSESTNDIEMSNSEKFDIMIEEVKNTIKELQYTNIIANDIKEVINDIDNKLNNIDIFLDGWMDDVQVKSNQLSWNRSTLQKL